ncbi:MAG: RsbRD N-terminal domain-containing protein [Candidatus Sumerlaeota bacterium]|nr:RsbRD N-terminal domain-containing protein [Candidatus Sumerlaeota bacterium]
MSLNDQLARKQDSIIERWIESIARSYPAAAATLFARGRDPFRNPVVHTIAQGARELIGALLDGAEDARLGAALDPMLRIRAVQDLSPAQAVGFVFEVKRIAREALEGGKAEPREALSEWAAFDAKIDRLALLAFEVYTKCREELFEIRVREIKKQAVPYVLERMREKKGS